MSRKLAILVPDLDIQETLHGLLSRPKALNIRPLRRDDDYKIIRHPGKDSGCYQTGHELLAPYTSAWAHGLVVFDRAWDGAPSADPRQLAAQVEVRLRRRWKKRARCIVIDPEIEAWVWSDSPRVDEALGWQGRKPDLRSWLRSRGLWSAGAPKPADPKRAFEMALAEVRVPPGSEVFGHLAGRVSVRRCQDGSFGLLLAVLREWFGT